MNYLDWHLHSVVLLPIASLDLLSQSLLLAVVEIACVHPLQVQRCDDDMSEAHPVINIIELG